MPTQVNYFPDNVLFGSVPQHYLLIKQFYGQYISDEIDTLKAGWKVVLWKLTMRSEPFRMHTM